MIPQKKALPALLAVGSFLCSVSLLRSKSMQLLRRLGCPGRSCSLRSIAYHISRRSRRVCRSAAIFSSSVLKQVQLNICSLLSSRGRLCCRCLGSRQGRRRPLYQSRCRRSLYIHSRSFPGRSASSQLSGLPPRLLLFLLSFIVPLPLFLWVLLMFSFRPLALPGFPPLSIPGGLLPGSCNTAAA